MGIQNLEAFAVHGSTENVPQLKRRLGHDLDRVAAVPTDKQASIVRQNLILELGQDIVHQIPVVIAVADHREALVRINLCQKTADMGNLIAVHSEVGTHHTMLGG